MRDAGLALRLPRVHRRGHGTSGLRCPVRRPAARHCRDEGRRADAAGDLADRHGPGRAGRLERAGGHHEGPRPWRLRHHRAAGEYRRGSCDGGGRLPLSARRHALVRAVRAVHYGGADYVAHANDEIVVMAMIETKQGLANLDAICATPGLDAVYIGPADLSFALGLAPRGDNPDPLHLATCDKILAAAHKAGIKCVMHCAGAAFAAGAVKRGFDMVMLTSDLSCMIAGARMQLDELKAKTA